ncbi:thyrotroph embryonic factor isoform X2 [Ambystoma mexicanum]|uniref:thyrotroph embryonic factor isoform X2 n=1 Tax=Ambystoma mexicanum TaxID=8296 RepID=UPI0037E8F182
MDLPEVLKSLLDFTLPWDIPTDKEDKVKSDDGEALGSTVLASAALMPPIWDKTIPYDGESFHLEYMDLDEFLLENGIPAGPGHLDLRLQSQLLPVAKLEAQDESASTSLSSPHSPSDIFNNSKEKETPVPEEEESEGEGERSTASPIDPDSIEVSVNFNPDPTDLMLSSVPGGELFDPRKHKFAEEELKPQPMIKKAKKIYTPEEMKDEKYWSRRKKNNVAAKRSRDARRLKENQITVRAAFLEKENTALRTEVAELRKEMGKCKNLLSKYETRYGLLELSDSE